MLKFTFTYIFYNRYILPCFKVFDFYTGNWQKPFESQPQQTYGIAQDNKWLLEISLSDTEIVQERKVKIR